LFEPATHSRVTADLIRLRLEVGCQLNRQSAELFHFPVDRHTALVRRTARALAELHGEPANLFWRKIARELFNDLLAKGNDEHTARDEIRRFSESVQAEIRDLAPASLSLITA